MSRIDLFKTGNFIIQFASQKKLELQVIVTALPGFNLGVLEMGRPVVKDVRPGDSLTYNDLSLTVLCDEDLKAFQEIYTSIVWAANPNTGDIQLSTDVTFDAQLFLTTNKNNIQHKVHFYNAFFKSVGDISLDSTSTDENYISFPADLGYSFYNFE
jgi:hypothetical protein